MNLQSLNGTHWLCDPVQLKLLLLRVASHKGCYSSREVARARRKAIDEAKALPQSALQGYGVNDPAEQMAGGKAIRATKDRVGVVRIHGPVQQRTTSELMKAGGTSTEAVGAGLDSLLSDASVGAIVLHVDSPGGSSYGIEELSDKIHAAKGKKPIYAIADSMMASAAYWLGTSGDVTVATPGADVGSVGVYVLHLDQSKQMENDGVKVTMVKSGKYKAELAPIGPLSEETHGWLQEQVDATHAKFLGALKRNRELPLDHVREKFGQGRVVSAEQALERKMVDRVMSFESLIAKLTGGDKGAESGRRASVEMLRLRHAQAMRQASLLRA